MTVSHVFPSIAGTYVPETRKPRRLSGRGYDPDRRNGPSRLLTDAEVVEARWLSEYGGWKSGRLARHYGVTPVYMYGLLGYGTRSSSRLFPNQSSFPVGYQPTKRGSESARPAP